MFITHVQDCGPFLKIFGQADKSEAIKVERGIKQLLPSLNNANVPPPEISRLNVGQICLGKYTDGNFYRLRITGIGIDGLIHVYFIDYGNEEILHVSKIRFLDFGNPYTAVLKNVVPQANEFILARVYGQWTSQKLDDIRNKICNEEVDAELEEKVHGINIIGLKFQGKDYSGMLVEQYMCNSMPLKTQRDVFIKQIAENELIKAQKMNNLLRPGSRFQTPEPMRFQSQQRINNYNPYAPNALSPRSQQVQARQRFIRPLLRHLNVSPSKVNTGEIRQSSHIRPVQTPLHAQIEKLPPPQSYLMPVQHTNTRQPQLVNNNISTKPAGGIASFKSNTLNLGSTHIVVISYVEDGPNLFCIQLGDKERELSTLMDKISKTKLLNLSEKPTIGMACIARFSKNNRAYRAVIMNTTAAACQVFYVDYGHSELVSFPDIYEIPEAFLEPKVFGMRFALSGFMELHPLTDHIRQRFKDLVMHKRLKLRVTEMEGAPFVQYGILYDGEKKIIDELKMTAKTPLKYIPAVELAVKYTTMITIRYVHSAQQFFVSPVSCEAVFDKMMDDLMLHCHNKAKQLQIFKVGTICGAKYDDGDWYRAEILSTDKCNESQVNVKYVDFGNTARIEKNLLRELSYEFTLLPCQVIECCLKGFDKIPVTNNQSVQLEMMAEDSQGRRKPLRIEVIDKLANGVPVVNLYDEAFTPPVNISKNMLKLSVAPRQFSNMYQEQHQGPSQKQNNNRDFRGDGEILNSTAVDDRSIRNNSGSPGWTDNTSKSTNEWNSSADVPSRDNKVQLRSKKPYNDSRDSWGEPRTGAFRQPINEPSRDSWGEPRSANRQPTKEASRDSWGEPRSANRQPSKEASRDSWGEPRSANRQPSKESSRDSWGDPRSANRQPNKEASRDSWGEPKTNSPNRNCPPPSSLDLKSQNYEYNKYENFNSEKRDKFGGGGGNRGSQPQQTQFTDVGGSGSAEGRGGTGAGESNTKFRQNENERNTNNNQRQTFSNDHKREKYPNIRKLIPRFNKQLKNSLAKGSDKERNVRDKNSSEGRKFDNSDSTSGKFSLSSKNSGQRDSSWGNTNEQPLDKPQKETATHNDIEEYVPFETEFEMSKVEVGECGEILMAWWTSPFDFFVYQRELHDDLVRLVKNIQKFYKSKQSTRVEPTVGSSVIARYAKDKLYHRARILDHNRQLNKYKVEFVDFGNRSVVQLDAIWPIEKRFMKLPRVAIRCSLTDIVFNCDRSTIIEKIDLYIKKESTITMDVKGFEKDTDRHMNLVEIIVDGKSLKESFIKDGLVSVLPNNVLLSRLTNQVIQVYFESINDLNNFRVKVDGCDTILPCSLGDMEYARKNTNKTDAFKALYENKHAAARVDMISRENILLLTPLIPLFDEPDFPIICDYPITSNKFRSLITHVESENILFVQPHSTTVTLGNLLDTMFAFYEKEGDTLTVTSKFCLCAAKSHDLNWYRGYIECEDNSDPTKLKIRYLDYGNTEIVPKTNLKILDPNFYTPSALAVKIVVPLKSKSPDTQKTINGMTTGFELDIEIIDFVNGCWIGDVTNEGKSIIDVLIGHKLVERATVDELRDQCAELEQNRVKYLTSTKEVSATDFEQFQGIEAAISHVDSPERFYLVLESEVQNCLKLRENIQITAPSLQNLTNIRKGVLCIAKYSVDEQWYRAKVLDFGDDVVTIQFIDYGNTDVITDPKGGYLKIIPEAFATVKPYAMLCALPVHPNNSTEWCEEATKYFYEYFEQNVSFEYISREGPVKYVTLMSGDGVDIGKSLVEKGYALKWDTIKTGSKCFTSHFVSLDEFAIQLETMSIHLELLTDFFDNIERFPILEEFTEGKICVAQFPEDNEWYRAKIIYHSNEGTRVLFIDYGNEALVKNLRKLDEEIGCIPELSKMCKLYMPDDIVCWSEEAECKFQDIAGMGFTVFGVEMYAPGPRITVNLYRDGVNILDELIPLCRKRPSIRDSMSESIVDDFLLMGTASRQQSTNNTQATEMLPITVCHVNSVNDFYAHHLNDVVNLEDIRTYLRVNADNLVELQQKIVGKMCIAEFPENKLLYRAKILSTTNDGCDVVFVDYGNTSFVRTMFELPDLLQSSKLPFYAKHFALQNLSNDQLEWDARATGLLYEFLEKDGYELQAKIVVGNTEPNLVVLYTGTTNINDELCKRLLNDEPLSTNDSVKSKEIPLDKPFEHPPMASTLSSVAIGEVIVDEVVANVIDTIQSENEMIGFIVNEIENDVRRLSQKSIEKEITETETIVNEIIDRVTDEINVGDNLVDNVFEACITEIHQNEKMITDVINDIMKPQLPDDTMGGGKCKSLNNLRNSCDNIASESSSDNMATQNTLEQQKRAMEEEMYKSVERLKIQ